MGAYKEICSLVLMMMFVNRVRSQSCTQEQSVVLKEQCINPYSTTSTPCSARGDCVCGTCDCKTRTSHSSQKYSGQYCECDDYACSFHASQLCGGKGICRCGHCECDHGYTGKACECPTFNTTCLASNGKVCNGAGNCVCGKCKCSSWTSYKGPTCEECPTCPGQCGNNRDCALCKGFQAGQYSSEQCDRMCRHVDVEDTINKEHFEGNDHRYLCQFTDAADDCRYFFTYEYLENNNVAVTVQKKKECPPSNSSASHTSPVFGVTMGIVTGAIYLRVP